MKQVRVTVLKTDFYPDLVEEYGAEGLKPCPYFEVGQVFESNKHRKPADFPCDDAWNCLSTNVFALSAGADDFYEGRWLKPGSKVVINTCNDGLRPVAFKLEVID